MAAAAAAVVVALQVRMAAVVAQVRAAAAAAVAVLLLSMMAAVGAKRPCRNSAEGPDAVLEAVRWKATLPNAATPALAGAPASRSYRPQPQTLKY